MKYIVAVLLVITLGLFMNTNPKVSAFCINSPTSKSCSGGNGGVCSGAGAGSSYCNETSSGSNQISGSNSIILTVVNIISIFAGVAAVIMIIIAAIKFVTGGGDSQSVTGARNTIIYAVVGLVIIALAQAIVRFVIGKL